MQQSLHYYAAYNMYNNDQKNKLFLQQCIAISGISWFIKHLCFSSFYMDAHVVIIKEIIWRIKFSCTVGAWSWIIRMTLNDPGQWIYIVKLEFVYVLFVYVHRGTVTTEPW